VESKKQHPDLEPTQLAEREGREILPDPDEWATDLLHDEGSSSPPSIGAYLAKQRKMRGISPAELCELTRIPLRSLERLESGTFDSLDDGFVRGFVRTVADALGLDPDDTLARMSHEPDPVDDGARRLAATGAMRVGILVAGFALVVVSVGLVRVAVQYLPGQNIVAPIVMRSDPVRALAKELGGSGFDPTQAIVKPALLLGPLPAAEESMAQPSHEGVVAEVVSSSPSNRPSPETDALTKPVVDDAVPRVEVGAAEN
jgi:hypothetical protein